MSVGIFARVSANNYEGLMDETGFKSAANILIAAGALVMIIGAIGCCGVMKEKKWLLLLVRCNKIKRSLRNWRFSCFVLSQWVGGFLTEILEINYHCFKMLKIDFYYLKILEIYFDDCKTYLMP